MNIDLINEVNSLIEKLPKNTFGDSSITDEQILISEKKYNLKLPKYYKWFIKNYNYIFLYGEIIKTVFVQEHQDYSDQDIFNYHKICLENGERFDKMIFLSTEDLEEYYFLINEDNYISEEVYYSDLNNQDSDEIHSSNFLEFLIKELPRNYRELR